MNQQNIEQQLWSFIDGTSTSEERSVIEKLLETNLEWKNKYKELLDVHEMLGAAELEQPSMRFTKNVMEEIAKYHIAPATKKYINKRVVWGIAAFFITMIFVFLIYGFAQVNWSEATSTQNPVDFSKIDLSKFFNNNVVNAFMMVNLLLGLVLLDRVLAHKRKKFQKQA
jgi:hypothetical protein